VAAAPSERCDVIPMRVAIADDSGIFRAGLVGLLKAEGVEVVHAARDGLELMAFLGSADLPDAVVLDLRMPPTQTNEGLETAEEIHLRLPNMGILMLSTYAEPGYAATLLTRMPRGVGYLLKDRVDDVRILLDALERVARGESVIDPELVRKLLQRQERTRVLAQLTPREHDVLRQMAQGRSNVGISRELHLGVKTVERHIAAILMALDISATGDDNKRVLAVLSWLRNTHELA
jgi:DNA-binding NarL/FixJ family response regulator